MTTTQESVASATDAFVDAYNAKAREALALERSNNGAAADKHMEIGTLVARFLHAYGRSLENPEDAMFLRDEMVSRCMQALVLRSVQLSGFADLAFSLDSTKDINRDIERARRRLQMARNDDNGLDGGGDDDDENGGDDPRRSTGGLYEFLPNESIDTELRDLPGYEGAHRQLLNAYFIVDDGGGGVASSIARENEITERKPRTRAGANVILHGPPGTGKTAAARAVARSLGLDLAFVNAENLLSAYRSETEKNLRTLYRKMRAIVRRSGRNIVLLLDEVDGLVKNRQSGAGVTSGEYSLLTRFLTILEPNDGADNYGVFSIFTTNRLNNLDDAFRRRCVDVFMGYVDAPESRVALFRTFLGDDVDDASRDSRTNERIARICEQWVPGDYALFKRTVVTPKRMDEMFDRAGDTYENFIAKRMTNGESATDRAVSVNMPRLTYDTVLRLAERSYSPVTPRERYVRDYSKRGDASNGIAG